MQLSQYGEVFRGPNLEVLVIEEGQYGPRYFSWDGQHFYKLSCRGTEWSQSEFDIVVTNPVAYNTLTLQRGKFAHLFKEGPAQDIDYDTVRVDNFRRFQKIKIDPEKGFEFELFPTPEGERVSEALYELPDGRYIYVSDAKYSKTYSTIRLYVDADPAETFFLVKAKITDVVRFKDGLLHIRTKGPELWSSPHEGDTARWGLTPLKRLNLNDFNIKEDEGQVKISHKSY